MVAGKAEPAVFEIGTYICPETHKPVPLTSRCSIAYVRWPVVVEHCQACGHEHSVQCEDVEHRPSFGYE